MEDESFGLSVPRDEMVLKTVHTELFRCMFCREAFRSENVVKKHLEKLHSTTEPLEAHYEAFMVVKKINVPISKKIKQQTLVLTLHP